MRSTQEEDASSRPCDIVPVRFRRIGVYDSLKRCEYLTNGQERLLKPVQPNCPRNYGQQK